MPIPVPPRVPDIVLIGAMKCATSTVSAWLERHPQVCMVQGFDPEFFSRDEVWARGRDWYGALFDEAEPGQWLGESSNSYTSDALHPEAAARMAAVCPGARLIYMVREPVRRILSHWIQVRADQGDAVPATPDDAVAADPARFVVPSLYWRQLSRYRALYPDERIWIGFVEELEADPAGFYAGLERFLGLDPAPEIPAERRNPSAGKALPGPLWTGLKALPGAQAAARLLPSGLKRGLRAGLSRKPGRPPAFSPATHARLTADLAGDSAAFLAHCGRAPGYWGH